MTTAIKQEFIDAVGGWDNLYHENGRTRIVNYSNRYDCTTGEMGGLPDVNTENPLFQEYFMDYINDLIECGADGFRYDTAKHIGLPDDPKDAKSPENDFWPIFTGRKAINGKTVKDVENLFIYGEVLQGEAGPQGGLVPAELAAHSLEIRLRVRLDQRPGTADQQHHGTGGGAGVDDTDLLVRVFFQDHVPGDAGRMVGAGELGGDGEADGAVPGLEGLGKGGGGGTGGRGGGLLRRHGGEHGGDRQAVVIHKGLLPHLDVEGDGREADGTAVERGCPQVTAAVTYEIPCHKQHPEI